MLRPFFAIMLIMLAASLTEAQEQTESSASNQAAPQSNGKNSEQRFLQEEQTSRLDWHSFVKAFSKFYSIGNLVIAEFEHMGKIAVGHKTLGFELNLPYAPDWKFSTSDKEPLYGSSAMLGVSVSITTVNNQNLANQCLTKTQNAIPKKNRLYEKVDTSEPVLWRYEKQIKEHLFEYNLWTFKIKNNTCFRYRLTVLTDHSPQRTRFVNQVIRYAASFQMHFKERVQEIQKRRRLKKETTQPQTKPETKGQ